MESCVKTPKNKGMLECVTAGDILIGVCVNLPMSGMYFVIWGLVRESLEISSMHTFMFVKSNFKFVTDFLCQTKEEYPFSFFGRELLGNDDKKPRMSNFCCLVLLLDSAVPPTALQCIL